ncbi:hypothetical protein THASP1DRAFT_33163 [Thamnocephalis sphaerospora]|uniref:Uncharacterized protein n=1 Tax=Thamnocephalis sphaerospora TaxID=78915 RepID=A0A4P9XI48_9FUNG|nr:hypothetical protein THASP1DRAFT_33163 [Thamnocephalis sphaerospora]|eukprot:RKP05011.1 hypothetical protein THASP1DRAFT_33163 [Thamnocephalis sphaerospora]
MESALQELNEQVAMLEYETVRLASNCERVAAYQRKLLDVCQVWMQWIERSAQAREKASMAPKPAGSLGANK